MSTSTEAYTIIQENGTQKRILEKFVVALKRLKNATAAEMIEYIEELYDKKHPERSYTPRLTELVQMEVFKIAGERTCTSRGFNATVYELTGKDFPKNFKYKSKKKLITKEQIAAAREAVSLEEALELLGYEL